MAKPKKLPAAVRRTIAEGATLPHAGELVAHFVAMAGGTRELAKVLWEEFQSARQGSIIRQRTLDMILRQLAAVTAGLGSHDEMDLLATEDLERELLRLMPQVSDGEEAKAGPGPAAAG